MTPATRLLEAARASTRNASPRENLTERERELLDAVEALSDARALYPAAHAIGDRVSVPARPDEDILPELRLPFSGDVTAVTFHEAGVRYEVHHPRAGYVDVDSAFVHPAPESPPVRPSIESLFPDVLNAYHCDGQRLPGGGWSVVHRATGKTGTLPQSAIILGPEAVGTWLSEFSDPAPVELGCLTGGQVGAYAGMGLAELRMHEWSVDVGAEQNRCPACRAETKAGHRAGCLLHEAINARLAAIGYSCEPDGTLTITDPPLSHEATAIDRFIAEELPGRRAEFVGTLPDVAREVYAAATGVAEGSPASSIADVQKTTFDPAVHGNGVPGFGPVTSHDVTSTHTCVIPGRSKTTTFTDVDGTKTTETVDLRDPADLHARFGEALGQEWRKLEGDKDVRHEWLAAFERAAEIAEGVWPRTVPMEATWSGPYQWEGEDVATIGGTAPVTLASETKFYFLRFIAPGGRLVVAIDIDGKVTGSALDNPDEAARAFWSAVEAMAPKRGQL